MDYSVQNILKQVHEMNDKYIVEVLKKYNLITNDKAIYEYFIRTYPDIEINYCEYLNDGENKIYLNKYNKIEPIKLIYEEPKFEEDTKGMMYRCYSNIHLEAGGEIL